jgi:CRP/FNR family transcriptional regulator, anaerobic regulatory protein
MVVLLQGTSTPLVHAHAGRTQVDEADSWGILVRMQGDLPPLILVVLLLNDRYGKSSKVNCWQLQWSRYYLYGIVLERLLSNGFDREMHSQFYDFITQLLPDHGIDFSKIDPQLKKHNVQKDDYLFREGEVCQFAGFIVKGCFRIFLLKNDKEVTFDFFLENRPIADYESCFRKRPTPFYFQAIEPSELLILTPSCFKRLFEEPPNGQRLQRIFVETLFFRLRDKLLSLYVDEPEARYLTLLQTEPELVRRVPQYHLASYLGIEPESLSRLKRRIQSRSASNLRGN